jgi:excisionase family DNA binding protein
MAMWMTRDEAANYLKVSKKTIDRWIRDRKLPAAKQGKIVRLRREDIDALMVRSMESQGRKVRQ